MTEPAALRRTALYQLHVELGARFTEFGGWEMPVRYGSIIDEHRAVRERAGLFDLSHMGELRIAGRGAADGLAAALVNDARRLTNGRAQYSMICAGDGGIIDDLIVYRLADEAFLVVPNASNREVVATTLRQRLAGFECVLEDETLATSLVAVQGPGAAAILGPLTDADVDRLRHYAAIEARVSGVSVVLARTGYTGEDGFELFSAWEDGPLIWEALLGAGSAAGPVPCGLGARDTLRLEAGMPLYGSELDRDTTPLEAGLDRFVQLDDERDFPGRAALTAGPAATPTKRLVGLILRDRGIARHGYPVMRPDDPAPIGAVTSGSQSPTLSQAIAMAYVPPADATPGTMLAVAIRDAAVPAEVVELPFYRRQGRG